MFNFDTFKNLLKPIPLNGIEKKFVSLFNFNISLENPQLYRGVIKTHTRLEILKSYSNPSNVNALHILYKISSAQFVLLNSSRQ